MNKKQFKKKMESYFNVYECDDCIELETWTSGGVNMIITLYKDEKHPLEQQLIDYIDNFDIDEEIDFYRQNEEYRQVFTNSRSLYDFERYDNFLMDIRKELI